MKFFISCLICLFVLIPCGPAFAQVAEAGAFLTVGAIRQGLNEALVGVQNATVTAGSEGRALGNSLQANIQNVISDIDEKLGKKLSYTFDKLDAAERQFATDARDLIYRSRAASVALASVIGDESRRTIGEADIAAYNTSYSLPCRTQTPRLVYSTPTNAIARGEEIVVSIHGNFLNFGPKLKVLVNGIESTAVTRNDRIVTVKLPSEAIQQVTETSSLPIVLSGLNKRVLEPRFLSWLFGCREKLETAENSSVAVQLTPRFHYRVQTEIWASYNLWSQPFDSNADRFDRRSDNCDHDENISFQSCLPEGMRAIRGDYSIQTKSGPSGFGPANLSGTRCVLFNGRLKGSGYDWILGVRNCRGSAWLKVDWKVIAQRLDEKETNRFKKDDLLPIGRYSHAINYSQSPVGENWRWRYIVIVEQRRGSQVIASETLTDGRKDNGNGWVSDMKDGVVTLTLPSE